MKHIWALRGYLAVLASLGLLTAACSPRSAQPLESRAPVTAQDSSAAPSGGSRVDQALRGTLETAGLNQWTNDEPTGVVEAMGPSQWTIDGQVVQVTPQTEIDDNIQVGDVVEAEVCALADGTLWLSEVELAHDDGNTNGNDNANSNDGDDSRDDDDELTGVVEAMGPSQWTIDGQVVQVTPQTEIDDNIQVGDVVEAEVRALADGTLWLSEVELAHDDDNVNSNANGNHDDDDDDDDNSDDGGGHDDDDDDDDDDNDDD